MKKKKTQMKINQNVVMRIGPNNIKSNNGKKSKN